MNAGAIESGAASFSQLLETPAAEEPAAGAGTGAAAAADAAGSVLRPQGLMTYESALERVAADRKARRHGRAMLRALGALQVALLGGSGTDTDGADTQATDTQATDTQALAQLAAGVPEADDPILRLILREIGVRAAVALARHGTPANISIG